MTRIPDRLTCEDLFRKLDDYLDRELSEREAQLVREHLETCAQCTAEYRFEESVLANLKSKLVRIHAPGDLMEKIRRKLAGDG